MMDPALSHEDKIMLFLMIIAAGQDDDRMRKMRELADVDAKAAAKKVAGEAQTNAQAERNKETRLEGAAEAGDTATNHEAAPPKRPVSTETEQAAPPTTGTPPQQSGGGRRPAAVAGAKREAVDGADAPTNAPLEAQDVALAQSQLQDQNNPEGPRSREVIMMELDRIGKMRDMFFEMVNQMMRQKNQTMRDIWRG